MSMIEQQVKELRNVSSWYKDRNSYLLGILSQAADTIEALSAKLAANMEQSDRYYGGGKIKLSDLKDVISEDSDVGITAEDYDDLPIVDTWGNWINGGFKTLDVEVTRITSYAYILLELKVDGDQKS